MWTPGGNSLGTDGVGGWLSWVFSYKPGSSLNVQNLPQGHDLPQSFEKKACGYVNKATENLVRKGQ